MKAVPTKKPRISIVVDESLFQRLERMAESEERSLSNLVLKMVKDSLDKPARGGGQPAGSQDAETLQLLIDFLNCLLDTRDYNGFSLAEIADILGRDDAKELVALFKKLKNGNGSTQKASKS